MMDSVAGRGVSQPAAETEPALSPDALPPGVAVVGNPYSGRGRNRQNVQRLLDALQSTGLTTRVAWAPDERRALLTDPALAQWCRCVVSAGGDGSLADAANDLCAGGAPGRVALAMLPMGNENLFARQFGHTAGPEALARAIVRGRSRLVDAGQVNRERGGRLFTLMVSAGFDAEVVRRVTEWRANGRGELRRVNRTSYAPRIMGAMWHYTYTPITVEADGEAVATGAHAFVFNLPQYGMGLGIAPEARDDDGMLDWIVFEKPGLRLLLTYGLAVFRRRHLQRDDVKHGKARHVRLAAQKEVPVQSDGDPVGMTPTDIEARPRCLRVLEMADAAK